MESILITGATSGIGNHLIKILSNSNYKIYFVGRNKVKPCAPLAKPFAAVPKNTATIKII